MRAVISTIVIAGAALLASACTSNESSTNITNTTEVPVENVTTTDTMVTNIDAAAPMDNGMAMDTNTTMGAEEGNMTGNAM
jgi:hypothetical protein